MRVGRNGSPGSAVGSAGGLGRGVGKVRDRAFLPNLRGPAATLERLRIDRELEEAITCGADPLHLSVMFGISDTNAIRWATNARQLPTDPHTPSPPASTPTRAPTHPNTAGEHSGSP
ncbi:hypothetical protein [Nocardia pseudovaccinii]|uniref:hypothetical protein n=1 Tax=Nocardia pseudovaccinii TaxID=189540 RepID=UPI0007A507EA|nr:hypothetical protein [Nocardia pseudovaccinii]